MTKIPTEPCRIGKGFHRAGMIADNTLKGKTGGSITSIQVIGQPLQ
jgi:hypothetical protein